MNINTFENNIRDYYNAANEEQLSQGLDWYPRANKFARLLARRYRVPFDTICRVIAVISPRLNWEQNKIDAETLVAVWKAGYRDASGFGTRALGVNVRKAFEILNGNSDALRGPKVTRFYDNIKNAFDSLEVTLDTHAYRVCLNQPDYPYNTGIPLRHTEICRQAYSNVAKELDLLPHQLQAVCWLVLKSKKGA